MNQKPAPIVKHMGKSAAPGVKHGGVSQSELTRIRSGKKKA